MEQLLPGWLNELSKTGFLGTIIVIQGVAIWYLDKRCWTCQELSRQIAERVALGLERCNEAMKDTARSQPELIATVKELAQVMQAVVKQADVSDDRSRERADNIIRMLERQHRGRQGGG